MINYILRKEDFTIGALTLGIWDEMTGGDSEVESVELKLIRREDAAGKTIT